MDIINADLYSNSLLGITGYIYILVIYYIYIIYIGKHRGVLQKNIRLGVFHGQFQLQTRDPAVYNKVLLGGGKGVGGLQALYKPYMLIKQHIKFLTAARKIANFLS